ESEAPRDGSRDQTHEESRPRRMRRGGLSGEPRGERISQLHGIARTGGKGAMKSYSIDAARTPRGRGKAGKGALSGVHPQELLAGVLRGLAKRTSLNLGDVDDVVVGAVSQTGEQGANIARNAVLAAGW